MHLHRLATALRTESLTRSRLFATAMLISAGTLVLNCGDPAPLAPVPKPVFSTGPSSSSGLLYCRPMAYDSVTAVIGGGGGDIRVSHHVLSFSPGTLGPGTIITAVAPSDTLNRILFKPEGLVFNKPVLLVMSYANCTLDGSRPKEVVYTNDSLRIVEHEPSQDDPAGKRVGAWLSHFSEYAIAW